jgi:serine/threonine protein kinase
MRFAGVCGARGAQRSGLFDPGGHIQCGGDTVCDVSGRRERSLTGVSPFYGHNYHEVTARNRQGNVEFDDQHWKVLSPAAKDLVSKMIVVDPLQRLTAREVLAHEWFRMDHSKGAVLATAQENMEKYNDKNRFNLEKIKPEFSMLSCTPLLSTKYAHGQASPPAPLVPGTKNPYLGCSPAVLPGPLLGEGKAAAEVVHAFADG